MRRLRWLILCICLPLFVLAEEGYIYFVVDGSGSMHGVPLQEAKNAMQKMAKSFFADGKQIALVVGRDKCSGSTRIATDFFGSMDELKQALSRIRPTSGHNITLGFEYAQEQMYTKKYEGHIYMFGDCDGLTYCRGIKQIAQKYKKMQALTPFTYLEVTGCTKAEKRSWDKTLKEIGGRQGTAATFDYESIVSKKIDIHKKYFTKVVFINHDGSQNKANNFRTNPWRCISSDGLFWLVANREEQKLDFYLDTPKRITRQTGKDIGAFIEKLNKEKSCGEKSWRLPSHFELSRLTQLGASFRGNMFPYINIWPHISATGGAFDGFKKGVNLDDGTTGDYREDRPYAAIFVSGNIDTELFEVPSALLDRYHILQSKPQVLPPKEIKAVEVETPKKRPKRCTQTMVAFHECTYKECVAYGDCQAE